MGKNLQTSQINKNIQDKHKTDRDNLLLGQNKK